MNDHDPNGNAATNGQSSSQPDDLHDLFATSMTTDEEDPLAAMRDDPNYGALIKELEYIAAEARRLFDPVEDSPSDEVWTKIQKELTKPEDS